MTANITIVMAVARLEPRAEGWIVRIKIPVPLTMEEFKEHTRSVKRAVQSYESRFKWFNAWMRNQMRDQWYIQSAEYLAPYVVDSPDKWEIE